MKVDGDRIEFSTGSRNAAMPESLALAVTERSPTATTA